MGLMSLTKGLVRRCFGLVGLHVSRRPPAPDANTMAAALGRLKEGGTEVGTVIDVGASDGSWSRAALEHWPDAACLLIEAQADPHLPALEKMAAGRDGVEFVIAAAGDRTGTINFDASSPLGGLASDEPFEEHNIVVPATTVDAEVEKRALAPPFLLKLDTHGFEVAVFEGAARTLERTGLIVVEAYNFKLTGTCLRFPGLCAFLEERGFRSIDVCNILRRPKDGALWQFDLFFVPAGRSEFRSNTYE